ncbi:hypothetical protein Tco_0329025 [Tanacetum coccineum]
MSMLGEHARGDQGREDNTKLKSDETSTHQREREGLYETEIDRRTWRRETRMRRLSQCGESTGESISSLSQEVSFLWQVNEGVEAREDRVTTIDQTRERVNSLDMLSLIYSLSSICSTEDREARSAVFRVSGDETRVDDVYLRLWVDGLRTYIRGRYEDIHTLIDSIVNGSTCESRSSTQSLISVYYSSFALLILSSLSISVIMETLVYDFVRIYRDSDIDIRSWGGMNTVVICGCRILGSLVSLWLLSM